MHLFNISNDFFFLCEHNTFKKVKIKIRPICDSVFFTYNLAKQNQGPTGNNLILKYIYPVFPIILLLWKQHIWREK